MSFWACEQDNRLNNPLLIYDHAIADYASSNYFRTDHSQVTLITRIDVPSSRLSLQSLLMRRTHELHPPPLQYTSDIVLRRLSSLVEVASCAFETTFNEFCLFVDNLGLLLRQELELEPKSSTWRRDPPICLLERKTFCPRGTWKTLEDFGQLRRSKSDHSYIRRDQLARRNYRRTYIMRVFSIIFIPCSIAERERLVCFLGALRSLHESESIFLDESTDKRERLSR